MTRCGTCSPARACSRWTRFPVRVDIRELRRGEERLFIGVRAQSSSGLASGHYAPEVIDGWCVPADDDTVAAIKNNADNELRLVAEIQGRVVGIAALVLESSELRACYVLP